MSEPIIRRATAEDAEAIAAIAVAEWEAIYQGFRQQLGDELFNIQYGDYREKKRAAVLSNLKNAAMYVTELEGRVVGFICFFYDGETGIGTISNNAVSGEVRGHGIGGRQYEFVFDTLREMGAKCVKVGTGLDEAHAPARRAYEKAGFDRSLSSITYYKML